MVKPLQKKVVGFDLGGFLSHTEFESQCGLCHAPLQTEKAAQCLDCHKDITTQFLTLLFHPAVDRQHERLAEGQVAPEARRLTASNFPESFE